MIFSRNSLDVTGRTKAVKEATYLYNMETETWTHIEENYPFPNVNNLRPICAVLHDKVIVATLKNGRLVSSAAFDSKSLKWLQISQPKITFPYDHTNMFRYFITTL